MCKVCLKSAEHTIFIIDLHHILHEIQLKINVAKTQKKFTTYNANATHTHNGTVEL